MFPYDLLGWPKGSFVFFHKMALVALSCLKLHSKQFCEIVCDRCHISVHLKKDIKIGEFLCSHLNIKDGRKKQYFRHIMLYYFKKGKNATKMQKKICAVYGEGAVTDRTSQKWFVKFRAGNFSLDDAPRSGRPVEVDSDQREMN